MKNKSISLKNICLVSLGLGIILTALRIYQALAITDGSTGFFTSHNFTVPVMYVIAAATAIVPIALTFVCADKPSGEFKSKPSFLYIFSVIFFAASLLVEGVKKLQVFLGEDGAFFAKKEAVGGNVGFILMIFSLLSVVSLLLSVVIYVKNGTLTGKLKIPMLFPAIWAFLKTLGFFSVTVSYVKVVSLLLTIFSFAFLMVFLLQNARVSTGIGRKSAVWFFFATGLVSAAFCFSAGIPSLIAHYFVPEKEIMYCPYDLSLIAAGLYAVASITVRLGANKKAGAVSVCNTEEVYQNKEINDVTENG